MIELSRASILLSAAFAVVSVAPATAEDRRALVITGEESSRPASVKISETLLGLGFDVERVEMPTEYDLEEAIAALANETALTVIYTTDDRVDVGTLLGGASSTPRFVFADFCADWPVTQVPSGTYFVSRADDCEGSLADALLDRLSVPGLQTDQWNLKEGYTVVSRLDVPFAFRTASSNVRLTAEDYAMLETLSPAARDRMIRLWRDAGIPVDALGGEEVEVATVPVDKVTLTPVRPVLSTSIVAPVSPLLSGGVARVTDSVSVLSRPSASSLSQPLAEQDGLPQPSILVGYDVENLPDAPVVPNEPLSGTAFGIDDVAAREALRDQDADVFVGLVEQGAFDPLDGDLVRALQVELARINCYTAGIDGAWGPGSQRALLAFYEEIGEVPSGSDADLDAFRQVIARDNVRCPDPPPVQVAQPVTQPRAPQQAAPAQSRRAAPASAPARVAPAQPAAPSTNRRSISQTGGTGVFR